MQYVSSQKTERIPKMSKNLELNKSKTLHMSTRAIALILTLTFASSLLMTPSANAAVLELDTFPFLSVSPNPIGVRQTIHIGFWLSNIAPTVTSPSTGDRWQNLKLTITKPDGTTETKGPYTLDAVSSGWATYTPTATGIYTFQISFLGQWINGSYTTISNFGSWTNQTGRPLIQEQRWYKPSTSIKVTLTVQQAQITGIPDNPLPTDYWTRPINGENKGWWAISGNWLLQSFDQYSRSFGGGMPYNPYTTAPDAPHIMWTKPIQIGGVVGGKYSDSTYYTGLSYEDKFKPPLMINGVLYYNQPDPPEYGFYAVDLRTGEQLWYNNGTKGRQLALGELLYFSTPDQHGVIPLLWCVSGTTWALHDAFTGNWILDIVNVPSGTVKLGPNGEAVVYTLNGASNWISLWNSTKCIVGLPGSGDRGTFQWRPGSYMGQTLDGARGIEWNVTFADTPGSPAIGIIDKGIILASSVDYTQTPFVFTHVGFNANTGQLMWVQNRTLGETERFPRDNIDDSGIYACWVKEKMQFIGFDGKTGNKVWETEPVTTAWDFYTYTCTFAMGRMYTASYGGTIYCYNATTGSLIWAYYLGSSGYETAYGTWPIYCGFTIADEKIYVGTTEHTPNDVPDKGNTLTCIDAFTGKFYWNITGMFNQASIADGYMVIQNGYDNQIYCFGKGPSATTVSAPQTSITKGSSVVITGSVTDQSSGQKGKACVSKESMRTWMEYLHMQKLKPTDVIGVQVTLRAIDPNGNTQEIGAATTDINGNYGVMWIPPVTGLYKIVASFSGTESYGSSEATTYMGVEVAPAASPTAAPPTPTASPTATPTASPTVTPSVAPTGGPGFNGLSAEYYIAITAVVIIVAIVAVAVILRRRK